MFSGYDSFQTVDLVTVATPYTGLKVFGKCEIDNIHVSNYVLTGEELLAIDRYATPSWIPNKTIFLATFEEETLDAGNITGLEEEILEWIILRKATGASKYTEMAFVDVATTNYEDRVAYSRESFEYLIIPSTLNTVGSSIASSPLYVDLDSWYLMSEDSSYTYKMYANLSTSALVSNEDVSQKQTVGKYDVFNKGNRDFISGDVSYIPIFGYEEGTIKIIQTVSQMEELKNFIKNGEIKILKSPKGEIWKVYTTNPSFTKVNHREMGQIDAIDFSFAEVAEI